MLNRGLFRCRPKAVAHHRIGSRRWPSLAQTIGSLTTILSAETVAVAIKDPIASVTLVSAIDHALQWNTLFTRPPIPRSVVGPRRHRTVRVKLEERILRRPLGNGLRISNGIRQRRLRQPRLHRPIRQNLLDRTARAPGRNRPVRRGMTHHANRIPDRLVLNRCDRHRILIPPNRAHRNLLHGLHLNRGMRKRHKNCLNLGAHSILAITRVVWRNFIPCEPSPVSSAAASLLKWV